MSPALMNLFGHFGGLCELTFVAFSVHPFIKKEWYNVLAPTVFETNRPTMTPCNKTAGQSKFSLA